LPSRGVLIRIDKPADLGVVISALQIIEFGLGIEIITPIAKRIDCADAAGGRRGGNKPVTLPDVVGVKLIAEGADAVGAVIIRGHALDYGASVFSKH